MSFKNYVSASPPPRSHELGDFSKETNKVYIKHHIHKFLKILLTQFKLTYSNYKNKANACDIMYKPSLRPHDKVFFKNLLN